MTFDEIMRPGFPHGTPAGYAQGCRSAAACPADDAFSLSCRLADQQAKADYTVGRLFKRGFSAEQVAGYLNDGIMPETPAPARSLTGDTEPAEIQAATDVLPAAPSAQAKEILAETAHRMDVELATETATEATDNDRLEQRLVPLVEGDEGWPATLPGVADGAPAGEGRAASTGEIRAWAKSKGYEVKDRGRIPARIIEHFHAVHDAAADSSPSADGEAAEPVPDETVVDVVEQDIEAHDENDAPVDEPTPAPPADVDALAADAFGRGDGIEVPFCIDQSAPSDDHGFYFCGREDGHVGTHAAFIGDVLVATWESDQTARVTPQGDARMAELRAENEALQPQDSCDAQDPQTGFWCTRLPDHSNDHVATDGSDIIAVWHDQAADPAPTTPGGAFKFGEGVVEIAGAVDMTQPRPEWGEVAAAVDVHRLKGQVATAEQSLAFALERWEKERDNAEDLARRLGAEAALSDFLAAELRRVDRALDAHRRAPAVIYVSPDDAWPPVWRRVLARFGLARH